MDAALHPPHLPHCLLRLHDAPLAVISDHCMSSSQTSILQISCLLQKLLLLLQLSLTHCWSGRMPTSKHPVTDSNGRSNARRQKHASHCVPRLAIRSIFQEWTSDCEKGHGGPEDVGAGKLCRPQQCRLQAPKGAPTHGRLPIGVFEFHSPISSS